MLDLLVQVIKSRKGKGQQNIRGLDEFTALLPHGGRKASGYNASIDGKVPICLNNQQDTEEKKEKV